MPGYIFKANLVNIEELNYEDSVSDYKSIEDPLIKLDNEFLIKNMFNIKNIFQNILNSIPVGKIYKLLLTFKTYNIDDMGDSKIEYRSQPGFLVYKNCNIDAVLYKFASAYSKHVDKYNAGDRLDCSI
jgi:hypothetical protein